MNALSKSLLIMLATAMVLFSCKSESVNPDSTSSSQEAPTLAGGAGDAHPNLEPECSQRVGYVLAKAGGGMEVDWSEFGTPAAGTPWGGGEMFNGLDENGDPKLAIDFTVAFGWSILSCDYLLDEPQNIMIDQNTGLPLMTTANSWSNTQLPNGGVNAWQLRYDLTNAPECYNIATRLTIGKLDFFSGINQNSITELWIFNDGWAAASANGTAPTQTAYVTNWCTVPCDPPCPEEPTYCDINFCSSAYEWIENVTIGSIDHTSGNDQGYGDHTEYETTLEAGSVANITMTPGYNSSCQYYEYMVVFIDYNRDGDFYDSGELVTWGAGRGAINANFTVPTNAEDCELRMRVAMRWGCWPGGPCCTYYYGEAEDYTIFVNGANNGRVAPRENDNALQGIVIEERTAPGDVQLIEGEQMQVRSGSQQDLEVEVLDQKGKVVYTEKIKAKAGLNDVNLNFKTESLTGYTYRVKGGLERDAAEMEMKAPAGME